MKEGFVDEKKDDALAYAFQGSKKIAGKPGNKNRCSHKQKVTHRKGKRINKLGLSKRDSEEEEEENDVFSHLPKRRKISLRKKRDVLKEESEDEQEKEVVCNMPRKRKRRNKKMYKSPNAESEEEEEEIIVNKVPKRRKRHRYSDDDIQ